MLLKIYLLDKRDNKDIRAKIIKEVYLINSLKAKILLNIDIIDFKKINIIVFKSQAYIESYDIIINIDLRSRFRGVIIKLIIVDK